LVHADAVIRDLEDGVVSIGALTEADEMGGFFCVDAAGLERTEQDVVKAFLQRFRVCFACAEVITELDPEIDSEIGLWYAAAEHSGAVGCFRRRAWMLGFSSALMTKSF
jgi:hypothetical protein